MQKRRFLDFLSLPGTFNIGNQLPLCFSVFSLPFQILPNMTTVVPVAVYGREPKVHIAVNEGLLPQYDGLCLTEQPDWLIPQLIKHSRAFLH